MPISSKNQIEIQLGQSLPGYVTSGFAEYGDAVAMVDEDGKSMTYSELQATINKVATALAQKGIKQGDCVMILSPNDLNYPATYHGILSIGAIATTCNPACASLPAPLHPCPRHAPAPFPRSACAERTTL